MTGRRFGEYIDTVCGLLRRYGSHEPTVLVAVLQLLGTCAVRARDDVSRTVVLQHQAELVLAAAERSIEPADLEQVRRAAAWMPAA
jgi:uncharacterized membrane protein